MEDKDALNEFLKIVDEAKQQFDALMLLSELIQIMVSQENPNDMDSESLDKVIQAIISYGDKRVFQEQVK